MYQLAISALILAQPCSYVVQLNARSSGWMPRSAVTLRGCAAMGSRPYRFRTCGRRYGALSPMARQLLIVLIKLVDSGLHPD